MNITKIQDILHELLKQDARLWNEAELNYTRLFDLLEKNDSTIIALLLKDADVKEKFFIQVENIFVFKPDEFRFFVEENKIDNSYTRYKNRIGLTSGKRFIKDTHDVVLDFPYKDCVLEGGQSRDEGTDAYFAQGKDRAYEQKTAKRKEIFYNSVLAHDEIDRLFDAKALTNWKRYRKDGMHDASDIEREQGTIKENLILKGNNLIALHSLKRQFAGKVKLIYIDPPYNTGNDSFNYNDKFNHSTWLVFMKNRLEAARQLLRDDGVIFVQCDDNEQAYLKVLMDEVFGRENFLNDIIWNSTKSVTNTAIISVAHTHTLVYFNRKDYYIKYRNEFRLKETGEGFSNPDNDPRGEWKADPFQVGGWRPNQQYDIINPNTKVTYKPNEGCSWKNDFNKFQELLKDNRIIFGTDGKSAPQRKRFLSEALERGKVSTTIWNDLETTTNGTQHLKRLFNKTIFSNPKPEALLQRIIEIATKCGDIVLDYHLGSGTTAAVAHKMGRQYIGIEQMDYIEDIAVARLRKVIEGEQGGISKAMQWKGGGSFLYCELAPWNEQAKKRIAACESLEALETFFDEMYERYFLNYNVKIKEFKDNVLGEKQFRALSLEEHKRIFCAMLDNNQMYVPVSEMADAKYDISETDQEMTKKFYGKE